MYNYIPVNFSASIHLALWVFLIKYKATIKYKAKCNFRQGEAARRGKGWQTAAGGKKGQEEGTWCKEEQVWSWKKSWQGCCKRREKIWKEVWEAGSSEPALWGALRRHRGFLWSARQSG